MRALKNALLAAVGGTLMVVATVGAQGDCSRATITAFSVEQYPGAMRNGLTTGPRVGTAVAVGISSSGSPLVPLGTVVWIEGVGERTVMDTGHGGAGWFDVLMQTTREAVNFGRQTLTVCRP